MVAIAKHLVPGHKVSLLHREHFKATRDAWTGLLNQVTIEERIEQEIKLSSRYDKQFALLMIDLTQFCDASAACEIVENKNTLMAIAKHLKACVRCTDMLGRNEDNQFIILLPDIQSHRYVVNVAQKIYRQFIVPTDFHNKQYPLSPAVGIAIYPMDSGHREGLVRCALHAKENITTSSPKNYRFFADQVHDNVELQLLNEKMVSKAIEQGEYDISYQPVSRVGSAEVVFFDAAAAWRNSLLAGDCKHNLARRIDEMSLSPLFNETMLARICRQLHKWQDQSFCAASPIYLPVTPLEFSSDSLAARFRQIVDNEAIATRHIGIIIRESTILADVPKAIKQIQRLKKHGFSIMIDEFCQGLAYIALLKSELVDLIRVDHRLVKQVDTHIESLSVIEGIVRIAANLQIKTIVPNIDTCYQYQTFLNIDADYWQGEFTQISSAHQQAVVM